jgi:hypothetical protein
LPALPPEVAGSHTHSPASRSHRCPHPPLPAYLPPASPPAARLPSPRACLLSDAGGPPRRPAPAPAR